MSWVTNIILSIPMLDDEESKSAEINEYLKATCNGQILVSVDDEKLPHGWHGGHKHLECSLYIGAINYIVLDDFVEFLRTLTWYDPSNLQLIVKEQEDNKFRIIEPMM